MPQDKDLEAYIAELQEQGYNEEEIFETLDLIEGKSQELETEDATAVQEGGASNLEDSFSGLPTYEEVERQRHNEEAQIGREVVSNLPGVGILGQSDLAVEAAAGFMSGITGLAQGVLDAAAATKLTALDTFGQLFDPEYAQAVKDEPELKQALFESMRTTLEDPSSDLITQYSQGAVESITDGDWEAGGRQLVTQTAQAIPSLLATATGWGGMVTLGVSAMGSSFDETIEQVPENNTMAMFGTSILKGGYELASEYATRGILKKAGLVFGKGGQKALDAYSRGVVRETFRAFNIEGSSEAGASLAGHLTDALVHGIELPKNLLWQLSDEYVVGGILGGGASSIGSSSHRVKAAKTEPKEMKEADKQSAAVINSMVDAKKNAGSQEELSLIDDVIAEETQNIKDRQDKHDKVVADMTGQEGDQVIKDIQEAEKYENSSTNPDITESAQYVYTEKANNLREKSSATYEIVYDWPQTMEQATEIKEQIEEKRKELSVKEKTLAKSENPNPASTQKIKEERAELKEKEDGLNKALKEKRPTLKEKSIKTPGDKTQPQASKEQVTQDFFKTNKKVVDDTIKAAYARTGKKLNRKDVEALVKTELFQRKDKYDLTDENATKRLVEAASKAVYRLSEKEGRKVSDKVAKEYQEEFEAEKADLEGLLKDEVINQADYDNELNHLKARYGAGANYIQDLEVATDEGTDLTDDVKKAYEKKSRDESVDTTDLVDKVLKGRTVDQVFKEFDTGTIYALLPAESQSGKFFQGIFSGGNPDAAIWDSYFDKKDAAGRKRLSRLKKAVNDNIGELTATTEASGGEILDSANDFLEKKREGGKADVKVFLPLLGKLKKNFPYTKIVISKARMLEDFIEAGIDPGKVDDIKGYTDGQTVVLNPGRLDFETPMHEYGHIWAQNTRSLRPELYQEAEAIIRKSGLYDEIKLKSTDENSVYYNIGETRIIEEAIATGIGRKGAEIFEEKPDQSAWDRLTKRIWDFLNARLGTKKIQDMTLDQFITFAATEIVTGKQFIKDGDILAVSNPDSMLNALERKAGATLDHGMPSQPLVELDYHGVRKTGKMIQELGTNINKYYDDLKSGSWILWQTGKFGEDARAAGRYDERLSSIAEAKFKAAEEYLGKEGFRLKSVPGGASAYAIVPKIEFLEDSGFADKMKVAKKLLNLQGKNIYRDGSPYKRSKVDQKTRDIVNATKHDFALRGHTLDEAQLDNLIGKLDAIIKKGYETQLGKKEYRKEERKHTGGVIKDLITETYGSYETQQDAIDQLKDKSKWIEDLKKGRFGRILARGLSPDMNNDFYGLLYSLYPTGAGRNSAKNWMRKTLLDPLESAEINYSEMRKGYGNSWKGLLETTGVKEKDLTKKSGIKSENGYELTNSQIVKMYNYIKDPSLYAKMDKGGFGIAKLSEILDYVDANPKIKALAEQIPSIFAGSKELLNSKLDSHGYKGVQEQTIKAPEAGAAFDLLARVYRGTIPDTAPYTPFTAVGQESDITVEQLFKEGKDDQFYSVMSGNLKERVRGGKFKIVDSDIQKDIYNYMDGPLRTIAYLDFAKNASAVFNSDNLGAMDAAYGKVWGREMRNSLRRIVTGKNLPSNMGRAEKAVSDFFARTTGGIMFLNTRSAVLQMISTTNFAAENPGLTMRGLASGKMGEAAKLIANSGWYLSRGAGQTELEIAQIFQEGNSSPVDAIIKAGYSLTKLGDKGAILLGGTPYVAGLLADGKSPEEALRRFVSQAKETQQSSAPERLGGQQTTLTGRLIQSFANTQMQYNRKMQKSLKDMLAKGSTPKQRGEAAWKIFYYGAIQNATFTLMQQALFSALDLEDEDEERKVVNGLNSMLDVILRGSGIYGSVISVIKNTTIGQLRAKGSPQQKSVRALKDAARIMPAVSRKVTQLEKSILDPRYSASAGELDIDPAMVKWANRVALTTNIPADRILLKLEGVNDLTSEDLNQLEKALRVGGWDRYSLDQSVKAGGSNKY